MAVQDTFKQYPELYLPGQFLYFLFSLQFLSAFIDHFKQLYYCLTGDAIWFLLWSGSHDCTSHCWGISQTSISRRRSESCLCGSSASHRHHHRSSSLTVTIHRGLIGTSWHTLWFQSEGFLLLIAELTSSLNIALKVKSMIAVDAVNVLLIWPMLGLMSGKD